MWEVVEKLIKEKGMNIKDLSRASGVAYGSLTDWKAGRSRPKIDKLERIAACLGVSVGYIQTGENTEELRQDEKELLAAYNLLNKTGRALALQSLLDMAEISRYKQDTPLQSRAN